MLSTTLYRRSCSDKLFIPLAIRPPFQERDSLEARRNTLNDQLEKYGSGALIADSNYLFKDACKLAGADTTQFTRVCVTCEPDFEYEPFMRSTKGEAAK